MKSVSLHTRRKKRPYRRQHRRNEAGYGPPRDVMKNPCRESRRRTTFYPNTYIETETGEIQELFGGEIL